MATLPDRLKTKVRGRVLRLRAAKCSRTCRVYMDRDRKYRVHTGYGAPDGAWGIAGAIVTSNRPDPEAAARALDALLRKSPASPRREP